MDLKQELLSAVATSPNNIGMVEADALDEIATPPIRDLARRTCLAAPSLNLMEFFYPNGSEVCIVPTPDAVARLASQIPLYVNAHPVLSHRQQHTIALAVGKVAGFVGGRPEYQDLMCDALAGYSGWPMALQAQTSFALREQRKHAKPEGRKAFNTIAAVCVQASSEEEQEKQEKELVIDPIFGAKLLKATNPTLNPGVREMLGVCAAGKFTMSNGAFAAVVREANKTPIPSDSLGNRLLSNILSCILPLSVPVEEKLEALNRAVIEKPAASQTPKGAAVPKFKMDKDDIASTDSVVANAAIANKESPLAKLFRPKAKQNVTRDYMLVRAPDGSVAYSTVEKSKNAKEPIMVSPPKPLAKTTPADPLAPAKPAGSADSAWFKTGGSAGKLTSGLIDSELITPTGRFQKFGNQKYIEAKLSPACTKKFVPKTSVSGFVKSLNGQYTVEVASLGSQDVFI